MDEQVTIARAREHIKEGQGYLSAAAGRTVSEADTAMMASMASAHFAAASAIANVLLADSDEWQGIPLEDR